MVFERDETIKQLNSKIMDQEDKKNPKNLKSLGPLGGYDPHFDQMKEKNEKLELYILQLKKDLISS